MKMENNNIKAIIKKKKTKKRNTDIKDIFMMMKKIVV